MAKAADPVEMRRFERLVLVHLDSAFNLARWILRDTRDPEDVVQDALLRAWQSWGTFRGTSARGWVLQIARNCCYTWLEKSRSSRLSCEFDEEFHRYETCTPESLAAQADDRKRLMLLLESLPVHYREVLVLRELEGCSYKEIAAIAGIPLGTVMSTLSRAREQLQRAAAISISQRCEFALTMNQTNEN